MAFLRRCLRGRNKHARGNYFATVSATVVPTPTRQPAGGDCAITVPGKAVGLAAAGAAALAAEEGAMGALAAIAGIVTS
jgi:hypothetical protein